MSKHTTGPWRVITGDLIIYSTENIERTIAWCHVVDKSNAPEFFIEGEAEANALLIAAAPELLAALKECITAVDVTMYGMAIHNARAAIAKATGDQT